MSETPFDALSASLTATRAKEHSSVLSAKRQIYLAGAEAMIRGLEKAGWVLKPAESPPAGLFSEGDGI